MNARLSSGAGNSATFYVAAVAALGSGFCLALQSRSNGSLANVLGTAVYAGTASFCVGLVVLCGIVGCSASGRSGLHRLWRVVKGGRFPLCACLGGVGGTSVVIAQGLTVTYTGVAIFTMCFVAGQVMGGLIVDNSVLSPRGRTPISPVRLGGSLLVVSGVVVAGASTGFDGIPLWAPALPFTAGAITTVQQALNGQVRRVTGSALSTTFLNFLSGSVFLLLSSAVTALFVLPQRMPQLPGEAWMLMGGLTGIVFIMVAAATVNVIGVLLLSIFGLLGNLLCSVILDLSFPDGAPVTVSTFIAIALVVAGVTVTTLRPQGPGSRRKRGSDSTSNRPARAGA